VVKTIVKFLSNKRKIFDAETEMKNKNLTERPIKYLLHSVYINFVQCSTEICLPLPPDRLWPSPPAPSLNGSRGALPVGKVPGGVKLTTHLHLVPMLRIRGHTPPLPNTSSCYGS
jgi:hypothetical protein